MDCRHTTLANNKCIYLMIHTEGDYNSTWAEKRSDLESHLEDFFIKASNLTRPDGIRLMKLDFNRSKFIDEANNLLDELEKAYHS